MADPAIRTDGLVKTYGHGSRGLAGLDLEVKTGEVYGYLGSNGAGKSTTIRILLDLIRPTGGNVRVLGLDPRTDGVALRRRIGYLAGDFVVDGRQTGRELLTYLGNLRGGVAATRVADLAARLDLDLDRKIKGGLHDQRRRAVRRGRRERGHPRPDPRPPGQRVDGERPWEKRTWQGAGARRRAQRSRRATVPGAAGAAVRTTADRGKDALDGF